MASSDTPQDVMLELLEKFEKVEKLVNEKSQNDPESEPYRSKYQAQGLLNEVKLTVTTLIDKLPSDSPDKTKLLAMLGATRLNLGINAIETQEPSTGEEHLAKCIELLNDLSMDHRCILILTTALNNLGILWSERNDAKTAHMFLEKSEKLYKDFIGQDVKEPVVSPGELFGMSDTGEEGSDGNTSLERTHTLTLYYLAQIYGTLEQPLKSAIYCHNTLKRQLEHKIYDPIDWALNAATLSQYFATHNGFVEARHHLAAASIILDQHKESLEQKGETSDESEEERQAKKETLRHRSADVARCWAKFGLNLLQLSQMRLLRLAATEPGEPLPPCSVEDGSLVLKALATESNVDPALLENLRFDSLELSDFEGRVSAQAANVFDEAREIFLDAKQWLTSAQEYYSIDHHASDSIEITQDMSRLYQSLAFFEDNEERQCRMHKRRVDLLEEVLSQLNTTYFLPVCRQMWFELAETYSEILEIKKQKLRNSNESPSAHALTKVNSLAKNGIKHLQSFLTSLYEKRKNSLPEELPEELIRPVLLAYFYLGKLHREQVTPDLQLQASQLKESIDAYKFIVDYCDRHEDARQQMGAELGIAREMLNLLPIKLRRLENIPE